MKFLYERYLYQNESLAHKWTTTIEDFVLASASIIFYNRGINFL